MRQQWISANMKEMREDHLFRMGEHLERSAEHLRWSYKRVANWNEQELGPADPKDSKATPNSDTSGNERGKLHANPRLHRVSLLIIRL